MSDDACKLCGGEPDECDCCLECQGDGYLSDGGCGGGCEYCRPFPACGNCGGTGKVVRRQEESAPPEELPSGVLDLMDALKTALGRTPPSGAEGE